MWRKKQSYGMWWDGDWCIHVCEKWAKTCWSSAGIARCERLLKRLDLELQIRWNPPLQTACAPAVTRVAPVRAEKRRNVHATSRAEVNRKIALRDSASSQTNRKRQQMSGNKCNTSVLRRVVGHPVETKRIPVQVLLHPHMARETYN